MRQRVRSGVTQKVNPKEDGKRSILEASIEVMSGQLRFLDIRALPVLFAYE
jgi:hypothetical protein